MSRLYLPLLLLLLLAVEGVAQEFLPNNIVLGDLYIIPHWILVLLMMIAVFYDFEHTYIAVFYAVVFGLLIDVVYTNVLGVYMFSYAIVVYGIHGLNKLLHQTFLSALLLTLLGIFLADIGIYLIYFFIGTSTILWQTYVFDRLIPTLVANGLFFLLLYPLLKRKMIKWSQDRFEL